MRAMKVTIIADNITLWIDAGYAIYCHKKKIRLTPIKEQGVLQYMSQI